MEIRNRGISFLRTVKKYRYAAVIAVIGFMLMLLPDGNTQRQETVQPEASYGMSIGEELEQILRQIRGAGEVRVMLTESTGAETLYQTDTDRSDRDGTSSESYDTVIITNSDRQEQGLVRRVDPATYLGAIILCQGADDPAVKLAISEAVSKITGLGMNKIAILKMN